MLLLAVASCANFKQENEINLKGKWVSNDNMLVPNIEFKGKSTAMVTCLFIPIGCDYVRDSECIRIKVENTYLLFEVVSEDTIVGSGLADGTWTRVKE